MLVHALLLWLLVLSAVCVVTWSSHHGSWSYYGICDKDAEMFDLCHSGRGFCFRPENNGRSSRGRSSSESSRGRSSSESSRGRSSSESSRGRSSSESSRGRSRRRLKCVEGLPCEDLASFSNGFFTLTTPTDNRLGATAELHCCDGYSTSGPVIITCGVFQNWSLPAEACAPVQCGPTPGVTNGSFVPQSDSTFMDIANLGCDEGYEAFGASCSVVCEANGTWSGTSAYCERINCGHPPCIPNGAFVASSTYYLDSATISCETGYHTYDPHAQVVCLSNRTWSSTAGASCQPNNCGPPTNTTPGSFVTPFGTTYSSVGILTCPEGWEVQYDNITDATIICQSDGSWQGTFQATCERIKCCDLPTIAKGEFILDVANGTLFEDTASVYCNQYYDPENDTDATITCQANGEWSTPQTSCVSSVLEGDCKDLAQAGIFTSGTYAVLVNGAIVEVYCDFDIDGAWLVIQRRVDGSTNFYRNWAAYKAGFGSLSGNFWLGLDTISYITMECGYTYRLKVEIVDTLLGYKYQKYEEFYVLPESTDYTLVLGGTVSGTAGDSLSHQHGMRFSTHDNDNDDWRYNCAVRFTGAWWYRGCHHSNLNGVFGSNDYGKGIIWFHTTTHDRSAVFSTMKIQRI